MQIRFPQKTIIQNTDAFDINSNRGVFSVEMGYL